MQHVETIAEGQEHAVHVVNPQVTHHTVTKIAFLNFLLLFNFLHLQFSSFLHALLAVNQ